MRIAILGFGKEGKSVLRFLLHASVYKGAVIDILDQKKDNNYLGHLDEYDLIVKSPGVPFSLPEVAKAHASGVLFTSATALFFDHAEGFTIGITGTKGKGTTATLLFDMLKACGKDAHLAGNIGVPMLDILPKLRNNSIAVLELSSFQLEHLLFSPRVAAVLDIVPDHLDAHASFQEYMDAKRGIVAHQSSADTVLYFSDSTEASAIAAASRGKKIAIRPDAFLLFQKEDMRIPGTHNFRNAVMAASIALFMGCDPDRIKKAALSFAGLPFRLERVRAEGGIVFYNDSAATNPQAAVAAVRSFETPTVLIAGGRDKGFSYDAVHRIGAWPALRHVVLVGENAALLAAALQKTGTRIAVSLEEAVESAWAYALQNKKKGEEWNIVFSPGAASFDMFENYAERGAAFNAIVKKLITRYHTEYAGH